MAATLLRISLLELDLRRRVSGRDGRRLRALGLGRRFGVVTPFNPRGEVLSAAANRRRLRALERVLAAAGLRFQVADGWSLDRRHGEQGFAVAADRRRVIALGKRFGQLAVFWFDGSRFLLVWCDRPGRGIPLPVRRSSTGLR